MSLPALCSLAQLPIQQDVTPGQVVSGLVMLLTLGGSLIMMALWSARYRHTGHVLPPAGRGILRVPGPLMIAGLVLGSLICAMVLTSPADVSNPLPTPGPAELADTEPPEESPAVPPAAAPVVPVSTKDDPLSRRQLLVSMTSTLAFDLVLLILFGTAVAAVSHRGRVLLNDRGSVVTVAAGAVPGNVREMPRPAESRFTVPNRWPDLDEPVVLPLPPPKPPVRVATAVDSGRNGSPVLPGPFEVPCTSEPIRMPPHACPDDGLTPSPAVLTEPQEPFSFLTELRFASEVFLAAWLPTAILRLIIVFLSYTLTGKQPGSHPFLEVMRDGIDWQVFALITFLAVIMAPLFEELLYRVVILGGIVQTDSLLTGLSVSSVVFCLAHGFPDSLALLPLAFALGYTYLRRRSYITVMLVHFLFNGFNMMIAALSLL